MTTELEEKVLAMLRTIQWGTLTVIKRDGKISRVDKTETHQAEEL